MTGNTQPDAHEFTMSQYASTDCMIGAMRERIADLEAQLEAIGAGGVSGPLMGQRQAMPDLSALTERGAKAWAGVDAQALREGRWYMVTHDGMATLCTDRRDAEKEAKDADMAWPHSGPHRAVQLVEASTAGFTAADMATASAQGFRDGVASLAAAEAIPKALPTGWSLADHGDEISLEGPSGERWRYRAASGTGTDSDFIYRFLHASLSANAGEPTCDMRTVVAVAVIMLYDTHPEDVLRVFDLCELEKISSITGLLGSQQVEDIYRRAWDHLTAPPLASEAKEPK